MPDLLIRAEGVSKKFCRRLRLSLWYGVLDMGHEFFAGNSDATKLRKEEFWAVSDISFVLRRGETIGLIGPNGAGKTTLLRMLNGLIKPDAGRIEISGRLQALIALGAGFNPVLTGRENVMSTRPSLVFLRQRSDVVSTTSWILRKWASSSTRPSRTTVPVWQFASGSPFRLS
jgi:lipopolysaccharide transport system ATP-binding protein